MNQVDEEAQKELRNKLRLAVLDILDEKFGPRITNRVALILRDDLEQIAIALKLGENPDPLVEAMRTLIFRLRTRPNEKIKLLMEKLQMEVN